MKDGVSVWCFVDYIWKKIGQFVDLFAVFSRTIDHSCNGPEARVDPYAERPPDNLCSTHIAACGGQRHHEPRWAEIKTWPVGVREYPSRLFRRLRRRRLDWQRSGAAMVRVEVAARQKGLRHSPSVSGTNCETSKKRPNESLIDPSTAAAPNALSSIWLESLASSISTHWRNRSFQRGTQCGQRALSEWSTRAVVTLRHEEAQLQFEEKKFRDP